MNIRSRERFIAEHDAHFDFQAGWTDVLERLQRTLQADVAEDPAELPGGPTVDAVTTTDVAAMPEARVQPDARPAVGDAERTAWLVVVALTGLLGVAGFVNSFARVELAMRPYFGALAWTVPLAVDVGILIFTALDLLMAYRDLRSWWLRYVPRGLVAVTIYLNVADETTTQGRVAHAVLPALWVIAVEVAGAAVRAIFGLRAARAEMDRIRRSRWLLAPLSTARLRRRMILREETSLDAARVRDLAFELAKADMRDQYGRLGLGWWWRAPRRQRLLLRRGEIAPVSLPALALNPGTTNTSGPADTNGTGPVPVPVPRTSPRPDQGTGRGNGTTALTETELVALAERIADHMETNSVALARRSFIAAMRAEGHPIGTAKATALLGHLRARAAAQGNGHQPPDNDREATTALEATPST